MRPHEAGRYQYIRMTVTRQHHLAVHQMVLEAFVGPRPVGCDACHNDGNRLNNALVNLRWDTASNNQRDKIAHGTIARGERNGWSKLTESDVRDIRRLLAEGVGPTEIGRRFGIARVHVQQIRKRRVWRHVA